MQYHHILLCSVYVVKIIWVNGDFELQDSSVHRVRVSWLS